MTSLNSRLQLALLNRKKGRKALEKGFTLVELMIVIVIVGILSAIALPNFLSQTEKAKATEAKTKMSAFLKQGHAEWQELGETSDAETLANADTAGRFTYDCGQLAVAGSEAGILVEDSLVCAAQANDEDASIAGKVAFGCVNLETGYTKLSKGLIDAGTGQTGATPLASTTIQAGTTFFGATNFIGDADVDVECGTDPS